MKTEKPNLYHYENYRKYLGDYYQWNKSNNASFSLRYFGAQAGLKSYNYLKLIIDGDRKLSETFFEPFCKALKLEHKEKLYFKTLIDFTDAKNESEKTLHLHELLTHRVCSEHKTFDPDQVNLCDEWYYLPLLELTETAGYTSDPSWIAKRLGISAKEARLAIKKLFRSGHLEERGGKWLKALRVIDSTDEIPRQKIQHYHHETLKKASLAVFEQNVAQREFGSQTFSLSASKLKLMKDKIKLFRKEIFTLIEQPDANGSEVYQLNFQLYQVSKNGDSI